MRKPLGTPQKRAPAQTRALLRRFGLRARKGLGQHFLTDRAVLKKVAAAAELGPADVVVEVGPGLGILTRELVKKAGRVIAVEVDEKLASALTQILADTPNLTVLNADMLQIEPQSLIAKDCPYKVIANIPYYITSPLLRHFLEARLKPERMVVMVQKEVAQAISAAPGEMSLLSVSVQCYARPTIVDYVPARSFYPEPKVDSAILRLDVYETPAVAGVKGFFEVVRAGFCAPRKQLRNALAQGLCLPPKEAATLLEEAGISPQRRAQTLTLEEWARLSRVHSQGKCSPSLPTPR